MRENLFNSSLYMIYTGDFLEKIFKRFENPNLTPEEREKLRKYVTSIKEYQTTHGIEINEIAIDRSNPIMNNLTTNEVITKQKIQNALSYAILSNSSSKDILEKMYIEIYKENELSYHEAIEKYGQKVTNYIIRNSDFDYKKDNNFNKKDEEVYYISEDAVVSKLTVAPLNTHNNLMLLFTNN